MFFFSHYIPSTSLSTEAPKSGLSLKTGPCLMGHSAGAPKMINVTMVSVEINANFYYRQIYKEHFSV